MTPEIHERYAVEIANLKQAHYNEIDQLKREHKIELHTNAQFYEAKLAQEKIIIKRLEDLNRAQEQEINRYKSELGEMRILAEDQVMRIDQLLSEKQ